MAFNDAAGWPAFWLYERRLYKDTAATHSEIDIMECYGSAPTSQKQLHCAVHRHPAYRPQPGNASDATGGNKSPSFIVDMTQSPFSVSGDLFDGVGAPGTYHTYGCKIDETWITMYFDGVVVGRFPTYPEALKEHYMLVSLQQEEAPVVPVETYLWVDYVKAYIKT